MYTQSLIVDNNYNADTQSIKFEINEDYKLTATVKSINGAVML